MLIKCSETSAYTIQTQGATHKKQYKIQNTAKVWKHCDTHSKSSTGIWMPFKLFIYVHIHVYLVIRRYIISLCMCVGVSVNLLHTNGRTSIKSEENTLSYVIILPFLSLFCFPNLPLYPTPFSWLVQWISFHPFPSYYKMSQTELPL